MFCWLTVYLFFSFLISPLPKETPFYGATVKIHEPVGVIGIACPDTCPLLAFVSLLAPAVIRGNTVVIAPSQKHPMITVDMYQVPIMSILFSELFCALVLCFDRGPLSSKFFPVLSGDHSRFLL